MSPAKTDCRFHRSRCRGKGRASAAGSNCNSAVCRRKEGVGATRGTLPSIQLLTSKPKRGPSHPSTKPVRNLARPCGMQDAECRADWGPTRTTRKQTQRMCIGKLARKLPQLTLVLHSLTALCYAALPCAGDAWQPYGPPAALVIPPYVDQPYPDAHMPYDGPDATPSYGPDTHTHTHTPYAHGSYDGPYAHAHHGGLCHATSVKSTSCAYSASAQTGYGVVQPMYMWPVQPQSQKNQCACSATWTGQVGFAAAKGCWRGV